MVERLLVLAALSTVVAGSGGVVVGVLSAHKPAAWSDDSSNCTSKASDAQFVQCNLRIYATAVAAADQQGVDLVVFPEAYGLARLSPDAFFEPFVSGTPGTVPCEGDGAAVQQARLSCLARQHGVALATNVFVQLPNGTRHITEIVFDRTGAVLAAYHKHHLFPSEVKSVSPGPFQPTTFSLLNRTFGIIICYEGVYPKLTGDYSQMDALKAQGASAFVWSIGGGVPTVATMSKGYAKRYGVGVAAAIDGGIVNGDGAVADKDGKECAYADTPLPGLAAMGYTAKAALRVAKLSLDLA